MRHKFDEAPLLAPGRHCLTLPSLEALCVAPFDRDERRQHLFRKFCRFMRAFADLAIPCEMMIDGSFLTEKHGPSDIDVAVRLEHDVVEGMTADQRDLVDRVNSYDRLLVDDVDGFVYIAYPRDHELFGSEVDERETWAEQYGIEHSKVWLKGVAILRLGETDVGLRIRS